MKGRKLLAAAAVVAAMPIGPAAAQRSMGAVPIGSPADWFGPDNYPPEAIRANRQGRVVVALGIDSAGVVATCTVSVSSGTTALDEGTCAAARERGRFNPATDRKGRPTAGQYLLPVRWALPDTAGPTFEAAELPPHSAVALELSFSAEGTITACKVIESVRMEKVGDPCAGRIGKQGAILSRGGMAVPYRVVQRSSQDLLLGDDPAPPSPAPRAAEGAVPPR